jgi:hypothetical protein
MPSAPADITVVHRGAHGDYYRYGGGDIHVLHTRHDTFVCLTCRLAGSCKHAWATEKAVKAAAAEKAA